MRSTNQSPLDQVRQEIEQLIASGKSNAYVAGLYDTSEGAIRRARRRWGLSSSKLERPGLKREGDAASIVTKPSSADDPDTDKIIRDRGLDPDDWDVTSLTVNEWDSPTGETLHQLKVHLTKKRLDFFPHAADPPAKTLRVKPVAPKIGAEGQLIVFTGDQQAPYHDETLHQQFVSWLRVNKPAKGILIGDTVDFPDISRHRLRPEVNATVQRCINVGYEILRDYVEASPATEWIKLCGNHDERIRNTLIDLATNLYGVKRAEIEGHPEASVLSVAHLLRLDELGIHYLEPEGSYEHVQVNVSPYLAARHGWIATKGSGSSALKTLEHLGYSVIVGHTHRQSLVHKTTHDINGQPTTVAGVETGCMCKIEEGLGYAVAPDWQNGFATAHVWPDGRFKIDLATHTEDRLLWRDQRYEGK